MRKGLVMVYFKEHFAVLYLVHSMLFEAVVYLTFRCGALPLYSFKFEESESKQKRDVI